ncbi:TIGR03086 family protein [Pseudonocardia sp. CNS-004]|nr:TIGR03086 family protein [Pseudonocardia sp. CNS-004]
MDAVSPEQRTAATPCSEWSVQDLIDHMTGSTDYLLAAVAGESPSVRRGATPDDYRAGVAAVLEALARPGVRDLRCASPLGFEWSVAEATAGTFMDNLVHTWDLAVATGQDPTLDAELVEACAAMFLPDMPERGRAGGIVGPAVAVPVDASPQDRLLGAMGRRP